MAESTLDGISVSSWTLESGFTNNDGVFIVQKDSKVTANDVIYTTLDDGDPVTHSVVTFVVTPDGGAPSSVDPQYPIAEDTPVDLEWTPGANGLYSVFASVVTDGGQGPLTTPTIAVRAKGVWTEHEVSADSSTELKRTADSSTELENTADSSTELENTADTSTELKRTADSSTERTGD